MVLSWFAGSQKGAKAVSVADLIAAKKYDKALELLREQFKHGSRDPRLRLQMADVLVLCGRGREAVPILVALADEYASEGFAAKAIALFKKIDKIDPGRKDVETKLASLIQEPSKVPLRPRAAAVVEEIDLSFGGSTEPRSAPPPAVEEVSVAAAAPAAAEPQAEEPEMELTLSDDMFRDQLLDVIQETLAQPAPAAAAPAPAATETEDAPPAKSPLFGDFSPEELMAVMEGLRLLMFEPGDIIITEGEPGNSLFVLTTGSAKAWIRDPQGRHVMVREMEEGSFFGEIALLTGKARTATVTAGDNCELLELDRATLDRIAASHPNVLRVVEEFYAQRAGNEKEASIRAGRPPSGTRPA
jgi:tetratricopeptide (TPR) repeat protein